MYDADGLSIPNCLFNAALWHCNIVIICKRCANETIFDPHELWALFHSRGWNDHFSNVPAKMRCKKCKSKRVFLTWSRERKPTIDLGIADSGEWAREVRRHRT